MTPILPIEPNASLDQQVAGAIQAGRLSEMINELALRRVRLGIAMEHMMRHAADHDRERASLHKIDEAIIQAMIGLSVSRIEDHGLVAEIISAEPAVILDVAPSALDPEYQVVIPSVIRPNLPEIAKALKAGRPVAGARLAQPETRLVITFKE